MGRQRHLRNTVESRVAGSFLPDQLQQVLQTLSEREAGVIRLRFGLTDGQPKTLDEVAAIYDVARELIRQIEVKTLSKLRHTSRSGPLRDYLDDDVAGWVADSLRRRLSRGLPEQPLIWCVRHGWSEPASLSCEMCPCQIQRGDTGRPRRYCSDLCRQVASRARRKKGA